MTVTYTNLYEALTNLVGQRVKVFDRRTIVVGTLELRTLDAEITYFCVTAGEQVEAIATFQPHQVESVRIDKDRSYNTFLEGLAADIVLD